MIYFRLPCVLAVALLPISGGCESVSAQEKEKTEQQWREARKLYQPLEGTTLESFLKANPDAKPYESETNSKATHYAVGEMPKQFEVYLFWKNQPILYRHIEIHTKEGAEKLERSLLGRLGTPDGMGLANPARHKGKFLFAHSWWFDRTIEIGCIAIPDEKGGYRVTITVLNESRCAAFYIDTNPEQSKPKPR